MDIGPITFIVTSWNSAATLERCLSAIRTFHPPDSRLIVVDDGSVDGSPDIARRFTADVIVHEANRGRVAARASGVAAAQTEWCVIIDSDVLVGPNTFINLLSFAATRPWAAAVSGLLAADGPRHGFATEYKNLYMNYTFARCPEEVTFIFGSIWLIKVAVAREYYASGNKLLLRADDTALGQDLFGRGFRLGLCRDAEVVHLKTYSLPSLLANDFQIPFDWARIFVRYGGVRQLFRGGTGFAHSSRGQLLALLLACCTTVLLGLWLGGRECLPLMAICLAGWVLSMWSFFATLHRQREFPFVIRAVGFTFLDHLIMACGIVSGAAFELLASLGWKLGGAYSTQAHPH